MGQPNSSHGRARLGMPSDQKSCFLIAGFLEACTKLRLDIALEDVIFAFTKSEVSKEQMESNIKALNDIYNNAKELERKNQLLKAKYDNDEKYARLHKRLMEKAPLTDSESKLFEALKGLKTEVDKQIEQNAKMLENENFVEKMMMAWS